MTGTQSATKKAKESSGQCCLCGGTFSKAGMTQHLKACLAKNGGSSGKAVSTFHVLAEGEYARMYWLHMEIPGAMWLYDLDDFLRKIWLECCGHLSGFTIDGKFYNSQPMKDRLFGPPDKSMNVKLYNVLKPGLKFSHQYDFGSTTHLKLRVFKTHECRTESPNIRLLARNNPPDIPCDKCGRPAMQIEAGYGGPTGKNCYCDACVKEAKIEEGMLLPIVNSPRVGVCAYCG